MNIEFLGANCRGRQAAEDHISRVYKSAFGAEISDFAPLLAVALRADGEILCAAGIQTAQDGFFSEGYLPGSISQALWARAGITVPESQIMEVVSLASTTPFPVLPLMDAMMDWGRENGMTCGVFTATRPLRRLLKRTGLTYLELAKADVSKVARPKAWGTYYDTDPTVCAFSEVLGVPAFLSPRKPMPQTQTQTQLQLKAI